MLLSSCTGGLVTSKTADSPDTRRTGLPVSTNRPRLPTSSASGRKSVVDGGDGGKSTVNGRSRSLLVGPGEFVVHLLRLVAVATHRPGRPVRLIVSRVPEPPTAQRARSRIA